MSGGALWYDAQMLDSERLTFAFVQAAVEAGAGAANHCEALRLVRHDDHVAGLVVRDRLDGSEHELRARLVVLAAGPWNTALLDGGPGDRIAAPRPDAALALNVVLRGRRVDLGVGFRSPVGSDEDPVCGGHRFVFLTPWRTSTLLGTSYRPLAGTPADVAASERDVEALVDECRRGCPGLQVSRDDVTLHHRGIVPLKRGLEAGRPDALAERGAVVDHAMAEGPAGLISVTGVKYTTARGTAERVVDLALRRLGRPPRSSRTAWIALPGGGDEAGSSDPVAVRLRGLHGSRAGALAERFRSRPGWCEALAPGCPVVRGEVLHAVESEMARRLADVVMRRTELGGEACPSREILEAVAKLVAEPLGWDAARRAAEIDDVERRYRPEEPS